MPRAEKSLSLKQKRFIPVLLASPTVTEACEKAALNRATYRRWMQQPAFAAEVQRQTDVLTDEAFMALRVGLIDATQTLTSLAKTGDPVVRRLAARDVVALVLKHRMFAEHEQRIRELEGIAQRRTRGNPYQCDLETETLEELKQKLVELRRQSLTKCSTADLQAELGKRLSGAERGQT
ncbi:MAG: hypothetical protein M1376_11390 [Planctomycetes bacterium]|nr:hypothetical protein [Planctomycetota bacterium]